MNIVNLIGRIVNELEVKKVSQDNSLLNFSVAYNERWGTREESHFFNIVSWGKQAETIASYFKKGQRIGITGKLKQERFQDKEGVNRSRVVIVLRDFTFIENKSSDNSFSSNKKNNNYNNDGNGFDNFSPPSDLDDEVPF